MINKIDTHIHLVPVRKPTRTAYTELLRNRAQMESKLSAKMKRWLKAKNTNLELEAELLQRWYPTETPCQESETPLKISRDKLRGQMHPAFEYDLEVEGNIILRVHRITKLPLTKKTMGPLVLYLARVHNKRKRGLKALGPAIKNKLSKHDWSTFSLTQLRMITEMWFPLMEQRHAKIFIQSMKKWLCYEEQERSVSEFLKGQCTKMDMILSRARHHCDAITEKHTDTLDTCLELYRKSPRSTAFETIHWLGPWFSSACNEDVSCPVCQEPMVIPTVTACQHAFCNSCIEKCTECPLCRQEISPFGTWKKCLTWFDSALYAREHAVQEKLVEVEYVTTPLDDDSYVVICALEEDKWDWMFHFDNEQVYTLEQAPTAQKVFLYQSQHFTLDQWEMILSKYDVPFVIHGRVDVPVPFRGSLFRSLSQCTQESSRAPQGPVVSWDNRPDVEQLFVSSSAAAQVVHQNIQEPTKAWVYMPNRVRGVRTIVRKLPNHRYLFEDVSTDVCIDVKKYQADAVSIHRWPGGRVNVGAFVVTPNTKGCIPCAIRKAQAFCDQICHIICLDCPTPALHCAHNPCKPTWRTTLD